MGRGGQRRRRSGSCRARSSGTWRKPGSRRRAMAALDPRPQVRHLRVHVPAAGDRRRRAPRARPGQGDAPPPRREPAFVALSKWTPSPSRGASTARTRPRSDSSASSTGTGPSSCAAGLRARGPADAVAAAGHRRAVRRAVRGGALRGALRLRQPVYYAYVWLHGDWASGGRRPPPRVRVTEAVSGTSHPLYEASPTCELLARVPRAGLVRPLQPGPDPALLRVVRRHELRGPLQLRVLPALGPVGPAQNIRLHVVLPLAHRYKYKRNYCLFCPIWDHLTARRCPTSQALRREVWTARAGAGRRTSSSSRTATTFSMVTHVPFVSPFLCSVTHATGWVATLLWRCATSGRASRSCSCRRRSCSATSTATQVAAWCLPVAARFYLNKGERPAIQRKLEAAVDAAERAGVATSASRR